MRKPVTAVTAGVTAAAMLLPATVSARNSTPPPPNIVDIVVDVSGPSGFDKDNRDYDLLREALVATELADAVATLDDITVFAPTDQAFIRLARDLGFHGHDEAEAFAFLADATGFRSAAEPGDLDDILLYHVADGAKTRRELRQAGPIATKLGPTVQVLGNQVIDGDPDDRDARIRKPRDLEAANGIIQTVNQVLRPGDLDPVVAPTQDIVEIVIEASGTSGFDSDNRDYDLLREALIATDLADAVATLDDITVFAPRDQAFIRLARDLGFRGHDEAEVFAFLAEATGFESADQPGDLAAILLYHVADGAKTRAELREAGPVTTLQGGTVEVFGNQVVDADTDDIDPWIRKPRDIVATNGIAHTINRVLRPTDLP